MRIRPALVLLATFAVGCVHRNANEQVEHVPPITVHVKNENFLDMNVAVVVSGVSRRIGTVSGNASGDFHVAWNLLESQSFSLLATPIGGNGYYLSAPLNVASDQMIEMRIGSQLRQSTVVVHEP